jgi:hypothetical protein
MGICQRATTTRPTASSSDPALPVLLHKCSLKKKIKNV